MTKRSGSYQVFNGKKPKLDDDDDDEIWDNDLDDDVLDKCFDAFQASQVCADEVIPPQPTDVSILPTYNAFKNPIAFSSSTQAIITAAASTSKRFPLDELEREIRRLKHQNEEKEGEISVLRGKIKDTTTSVHAEQQKTTNEWRDKLNTTQKEVKSVKSDLEFKNLEIANLKQQLLDLRRLNLDSTINNTQILVPQPVVKENHERMPTPVREHQLKHKEAILEPIYPLKSICPKSFTEPTGENHLIQNISFKISRNTIPCLQNQQTYKEANFNHKCPRLGNKKITLENVYADIFKLVNCNYEELNSASCTEAINNVLCVTLILLKDLNDYLVELGSHLKTEDIQQSDVNYLLNEVHSESMVRSQHQQLGTQASKILDVISRLVLCTPYTAEFICHDKRLKLHPHAKAYAMLIPHRNGAVQSDYYLLRLLLTIVSNIGKYRLAEQTNTFLLSTEYLLECIAVLGNTTYMHELTSTNGLFCKIFKEMVFARPGLEVIQKITFLIKVSSHYKTFIRYLFKKNGNNELLKAGPKGVLYYNEDVCSFCVLAIFLQNYTSKTKKVPLEVCCNILSFIYNTFKTSDWIHHESGDNVCVCLSQLYKLEIEFVYRGIANFVECHKRDKNNSRISDEWSIFLNHEIVQKVLNQMNFNNYELTEKYVMVFSQFKEIEKTLKSEGLFNVAQLNISEELLQISHESFNKDF